MKEIIINVDSESDIYNTFGGVGELNEEFIDYVLGVRLRLASGKPATAPSQAFCEAYEQ